jgi:hypothetical protein
MTPDEKGAAFAFMRFLMFKVFVATFIFQLAKIANKTRP